MRDDQVYADWTVPSTLIETRRPLRRRCGDDVLQELGEVAVGLIDLALAIGAVSALDEVGDAVELRLAAEVLSMLAQPVDQPLGQHLRRHPLAVGQVDELALEPVPRRDP